MSREDWHWWVGSSDESYTTKCLTREEAVQVAIEEYEGGYICEAIHTPIDLSQEFKADRFLTDVEEQRYDDWNSGFSDDIVLKVTPEQEKDLQSAVASAIKDWQKKHNLVFMPFLFSKQRNDEYIEAPDTEVSET